MNYARNEDMLCDTGTIPPAYSGIINIAFSNEGDELITVAEAKEYLRIDASETAFDDRLTKAIKRARGNVELYLNRSLIKRTVTATMNIAGGKVQLYGPVIEPVADDATITNPFTVTDANNSTVDATAYQRNGNAITGLNYNQATFVYTAGYDVLPDDLKDGVLALVAYDFSNNAGDGNSKRNIGDITGLRSYRRVV